jgi:hypothetical protein
VPHYVSKSSRTLPVSLAEAKEQLELHASTSHDNTLRRYLLAATAKASAYCRRDWHLTKRVLQLDRWHDLDDRDSLATRLAYSGRSLQINHIEIPQPPLVAVDSITYLDTDGTRQTLSSASYTVDSNREPGRVLPVYNDTWPSARYDSGSIEITHYSGYTQTFTAATSDVITPTDQRWSDGDIITLDNYGGALPAGLSANVYYYVIQSTATTFKLSLEPNGAAVDVTDTGTGTSVINDVPQQIKQSILLTVNDWFEDRGGENEMPKAAKYLLDGLRVVSYAGHYALQR